jgi:peptidoglycan hydrolase-like protein with peptidoglycan-binding domain
MAFKSHLSSVTKQERADLLTLALASLALRAQERVGLIGSPDVPGHTRGVLMRMAQQILRHEGGRLPVFARPPRLASAVLVASSVVLSGAAFKGLLWPPRAAQAQSTQSGEGSFRVAEAKKKDKDKAQKKSTPKEGGGNYGSMPLAERVGIQLDLAWTGFFNGLINGEFNDRSVAAVKAYQKDFRFKETGVLAPAERAQLAAMSKAKQEQVDWRMVDDKATGAQVGLPTRQVPNVSKSQSGTRWSSAQGQIQVETFRLREPGMTLATLFEQQKKEPPNRQLEVNLLRNDFFILSGMQGLKKFYVRAEIRDLEVRGLTILYDQATDGIMDPVTVVMSSAFAPFPGTGLTALMGPAPRRKVEYGTGIVVTAAGHILTDRQLTDGCNVVQVSGHGDADPVASDEAAGVALLRVYGAANLAPAPLVHEGAKGPDLTLVGIADPQSQAGARAVTTAAAKLNGDDIQPPPQLGFAGAAALDAQGRLFGMVTLKSPVVAGNGTTVPDDLIECWGNNPVPVPVSLNRVSTNNSEFALMLLKRISLTGHPLFCWHQRRW